MMFEFGAFAREEFAETAAFLGIAWSRSWPTRLFLGITPRHGFESAPGAR